MNKLEKIERDAQKAREKITAMQTILKQIEGQRTEQENLQIVQQVRNLKLSREELYAFLGGGGMPATLTAMLGGEADTGTAATEPETVYSRRGKQRNAAPGGDAESEAETANDDESEETDDEE